MRNSPDTRCLVIKNDGIGDLIASSGLISGLAQHFDGSLDLVTCEQNREVAEAIEGVRRVLYISRDGLRFRNRPQRLGIAWPKIDPPSRSSAAALRKTRYEVAICLRRYIRVATFACMSLVRARRKFAFWQFPTNLAPPLAEKLNRGWEHLPGDERILPEIAYYRDALKRALDVELDATPRLKFIGSSSAIRSARTVGLCIGGSGSRWPGASWVELAGLLRADGWGIVLFGGPDSAELAGTLERAFGCDNRVGGRTLEECAAELAPLDAVISNDTGLAHLASLVSPRTIVIMSGVALGRFLPWPDTTNQFVLFHGLDCFDCDGACKFSEKECHLLVRPSAVFHYFLRVMAGRVEPGLQNLNPRSTTYTLSWRRTGGGASIEIPAGTAEDVKPLCNRSANGHSRETLPRFADSNVIL
jgi:ADP-heptose:LPS heptosyltransferase